jgi:hypothetical protein
VAAETRPLHSFEKLEAYNMLGEIVFEEKINPDLSMAQQEFTVDFSDLPKGAYFVILSNKEVVAIEKLIIQ